MLNVSAVQIYILAKSFLVQSWLLEDWLRILHLHILLNQGFCQWNFYSDKPKNARRPQHVFLSFATRHLGLWFASWRYLSDARSLIECILNHLFDQSNHTCSDQQPVWGDGCCAKLLWWISWFWQMSCSICLSDIINGVNHVSKRTGCLTVYLVEDVGLSKLHLIQPWYCNVHPCVQHDSAGHWSTYFLWVYLVSGLKTYS